MSEVEADEWLGNEESRLASGDDGGLKKKQIVDGASLITLVSRLFGRIDAIGCDYYSCDFVYASGLCFALRWRVSFGRNTAPRSQAQKRAVDRCPGSTFNHATFFFGYNIKILQIHARCLFNTCFGVLYE